MKPQKKEYSRPRRIARTVVWAVFGLVLLVQYLMITSHRPHRMFFRPDRQEDWRRRRPPTEVRSPVQPVPKDLFRVHIEIAPKDVETLRQQYWDRQGNQDDRPRVLVTVREDDKVYSNVVLNLKGAAGSFRHFDDKPALTLNFAKHVPDQKFHGYSKISLNNSVQDPTYLCEVISRELFAAAGVPAPRAEHATVLINGRDLGLYVLTEGWNKDFLRRYFKVVDGNLYDGGFCQEVHPNLHINSGDFRSDRRDLKQLLDAVAQSDPEVRWLRLHEILDMDRFIRGLAMEMLLCHWDGYALNRNNYRIFHDLETDRLVFMPHGMDQMFGADRTRRMSPRSSIFPHMQGIVAQKVVGTPPGRRRYFQTLGTLYTNLLDASVLTNRVLELAQRIRPTIEAYDPRWAKEHDDRVATLCDRIAERARYVSEQLNHSWDPIEFGANRTVVLTNWTPFIPASARTPGRHEKTVENGRELLHVVSDSSSASWRTTALLESGRYRFEGRVRSSGDGRVCLRTSGRQDVELVQRANWAALSFRFAIREPLDSVHFVCEVRGVGGEAWFDAQSLKLVRE